MKYYEASRILKDWISAELPSCNVFEIANQKLELSQKAPFVGIIADVGAMESNNVYYTCPFYLIAGVSNPDAIIARNEAYELLATIYKNIHKANIHIIKHSDSPFEYIAYHSNLTLMSLQIYVVVEL